MKIMIDITNNAILKEMAEAYVKVNLGYGVSLQDLEVAGTCIKGMIVKEPLYSGDKC